MIATAAHAEVTTAFVQLGLILLGLGLAARVADRAGFSPIPLYLLGGLAVRAAGLLPAKVTDDFIGIAAEIGVLQLLFALGLEYTAPELSAELRRNFRAGIVDLVANFLPGLLLGLVLGWSAVASVLLGGVSYVSSSGIIAKLLGDLGRLGNRETPTILSILVLEDLTMAIYLPIVAVLLAGAGVLTGLVSLAVALGVVAVIVLFAVKIGPWLSRVVDSESNEVTVLVILGLVLFVGGLVQEVDVSAAVGAFLVGLALSGPVQHRAATLIEPLGNVFAAIFFFVFGLGIDATAVPPVILPALGLAVVTAATKAGLGWWAAGRAGVGKHGRWRAATTLIVRGEFSIVIAGLGVAAGVEGQLGPLAAAYVLVLAVVGSLLVRVARLPGFLDRSARGESRPGTV
ncbi:MAG TPA: cation:proton antiporter [Microthrixaceae bacterium]|nr:cation:proton antiporter [Microthrixaceae bacterium]MCB9374896.1 cation:proton antiporter [Microthrixaceae bacterium]MCB9400949.1 cation:proton antiporter [Microthrixaceae bacterium]MCO5304936.1 cation:proton antiporter [Microthrixaceae bacterium]HMU79184.1 cation:proton antiporter [Microthrixaceae bacterium]